MVKVLAEKEEDEIGVDFVFVGLMALYGEDESASRLIFGVLPLGLNALFEVLKRVDSTWALVDEVAA